MVPLQSPCPPERRTMSDRKRNSESCTFIWVMIIYDVCRTAKKGEEKPDEMGEEKADVKGEEEKPDKQPAAPKSDASITKGAILHFKGCGETTSREDIKVSD